MLILLEGPDGAGKTTLADLLEREIRERFPDHAVTRLHAGPPVLHPLDEYVTPLLDYRPGQGRHVICDRWHWGEAVYPEVLHRPSRLTPEVFHYTELFLAGRGALLVHVTQPDPVLRHRLGDRGDDLVTATQALDAAVRFRRLVDDHPLLQDPAFRLRVRPVTAVDVPDLVAAARRRERDAWDPHEPVTYVGPRLPEVLLVGDTRVCLGIDCYHRTPHDPRATAFVPWPATSGAYLWRELYLSLWDRRLAVVNACDVDNVLTLPCLDTGTAVVALGRRAHDKLDRLQIRHATVAHPQYVRRFHHHTGRVLYGRLIADVIGTERNEIGWIPPTSSTPSSSAAARVRRSTPAWSPTSSSTADPVPSGV